MSTDIEINKNNEINDDINIINEEMVSNEILINKIESNSNENPEIISFEKKTCRCRMLFR